MSDISESLQRENDLVLDLVQASQGLISRDIGEITIEVYEGGVRIFFAVRADNTQIREDVDDIAFELSVLVDRSLNIETHIEVGAFRPDWPGASHRPFYRAKFEEWND